MADWNSKTFFSRQIAASQPAILTITAKKGIFKWNWITAAAAIRIVKSTRPFLFFSCFLSVFKYITKKKKINNSVLVFNCSTRRVLFFFCLCGVWHAIGTSLSPPPFFRPLYSSLNIFFGGYTWLVLAFLSIVVNTSPLARNSLSLSSHLHHSLAARTIISMGGWVVSDSASAGCHWQDVAAEMRLVTRTLFKRMTSHSQWTPPKLYMNVVYLFCTPLCTSVQQHQFMCLSTAPFQEETPALYKCIQLYTVCARYAKVLTTWWQCLQLSFAPNDNQTPFENSKTFWGRDNKIHKGKCRRLYVRAGCYTNKNNDKLKKKK